MKEEKNWEEGRGRRRKRRGGGSCRR